MRNKNLHRFVPILLFLLVLIVYFFTMPNVNTGYADSDEFLAVAKIFGVAHPPSYPLYTMFAALFGRLPIPFLTFAGRINFLSVILHSFTVVFVYLIGFKLLKRFIEDKRIAVLIALAGALSLAFMFSFWFFALFAEVFQLNNFFISLTMLLLIIWEEKLKTNEDEAKKYLYASVISLGLGISNQQAILLLFPAYFFFVLMTDIKTVLNIKNLFRNAIILVLGVLIPYVYILIASSRQPIINWGKTSNGNFLNNLYSIITRQIYSKSSGSAYNIAFRLDKLDSGVLMFVNYLLINYGIALTLIGIIGIVYLLIKKQYKIFTFLILGIFGGGLLYSIISPFGITKGQPDYLFHLGIYERFFLSSPIFFSILISFGLVAIGQLLNKTFSRYLWYVVIISIYVGLLLIATSNFQEIKKNNFFLGHYLGKRLLESLEPNAILFCFNDTSCFTTLYMQQVEGIRKDVLTIEYHFRMTPLSNIRKTNPNLFRTSVSNHQPLGELLLVRDIIRWQIDKRPIYLAGINPDMQIFSIHGLNGNPFYLQPVGCVMKVSRTFSVTKENSCKTVEDILFNSYFTEKAPISDMPMEYLMYLRYLNAYIYAAFSCTDASLYEIKIANKIDRSMSGEIKKVIKNLLNKGQKNSLCTKKQQISPQFLFDKVKESEERNSLSNELFYLSQLTMLEPKDINLRLKYADTLLKANVKGNAYLEYTDILVLDPNNKKAKEALQKLDIEMDPNKIKLIFEE